MQVPDQRKLALSRGCLEPLTAMETETWMILKAHTVYLHCAAAPHIHYMLYLYCAYHMNYHVAIQNTQVFTAIIALLHCLLTKEG